MNYLLNRKFGVNFLIFNILTALDKSVMSSFLKISDDLANFFTNLSLNL